MNARAKVFYPSGQEFFPKARILNKYEFALLYRFSALLGHEVKLCTALWINRSVVLGFIQCFPQAKSQLCFGFLALIPFAGEKQARYVRVRVTTPLYVQAYEVTLAEIGLY